MQFIGVVAGWEFRLRYGEPKVTLGRNQGRKVFVIELRKSLLKILLAFGAFFSNNL